MPQTPPTIRWVEEFALSTDGWIKAFPLGEYKRNGRTLSITAERVKRMESNFKRGTTGYAPPINIEHLPEHGRIGVIKDMEARGDGLYVLPDDEARAFLQSRKFGYVSPEIVWQNYENSAGEKADDVVVGLAATNTPFFGEHVALFSARDDWNKQELAMADKQQEDFAVTADEVIEHNNTVSSFLRWAKKAFGPQAAEAVEDAVKDAAKEDDKVSGDKKDKASAVAGVDVAQFNAWKAQLETQYAEQYAAVKAENERLAAAVAAEQYRAELGVMDKFAAKFDGLARPEKFSEHLLTWKTKLGAEEFGVLTETLRAANEAVKAGGLFSRRSTSVGGELDAEGQFDAEVSRYMAENKVTKPVAIAAVAETRPELYTAARQK